MKLPKIKTLHQLNQNNSNQKESSSLKIINSYLISPNNCNSINNTNTSNKIFFKKFNSTKFIPKLLKTLKISNHFLNIEEKPNKELEEEDNEDSNIIYKKINSYREINLPKKEYRINNINSNMKKNNLFKLNKKLKIIKSSDNLLLSNNFNNNDDDNNTINANEINNILLDDKSIIVNQIDNDKNANNEKDEDKTILSFPSNILKLEQRNNYTIRKFKYADLINSKNELNKETSKKKTINYNFDNKKFHDHYIFFNNSFIKKNSWNNHLLKNLLPKNINYILKEEEYKKILKNNNRQNNLEKEKNKSKNKKLNKFRNMYNNYHCNSFFNSEINNFCNNYKNNNNNNFIKISSLSTKNDKKIKNRIYLEKIPKNFFYNYCIPNKRYNENRNVNTNFTKNNTFDLIYINSLFHMKSYN